MEGFHFSYHNKYKYLMQKTLKIIELLTYNPNSYIFLTIETTDHRSFLKTESLIFLLCYCVEQPSKVR